MKRTAWMHTSRVSPTAKCIDIYIALSLRWQPKKLGGVRKETPLRRGFSYFLYVVHRIPVVVAEKIDSLTAERVCECGSVDILLLHCCCNCNSSAKSLISFRPAARESPTQTPKSRLCFLWLLHSQLQAIFMRLPRAPGSLFVSRSLDALNEVFCVEGVSGQADKRLKLTKVKLEILQGF